MTRLTALLAAAIALSPAAALANDAKPWVREASPATVSAGGLELATKHFRGTPTHPLRVSFGGSSSTRPAAGPAEAAAAKAVATMPCDCHHG